MIFGFRLRQQSCKRIGGVNGSFLYLGSRPKRDSGD
jgi:hypothetical protein